MRKILLCLDADAQPSVFDSVVALDAGVDHLLRHGGVSGDMVRDLVYGLMFTRGPDRLKDSAVFIGGSDVSVAETLLQQAVACFFGPIRVSVMLDASGANTTAAAAVIAAASHLSLTGTVATVMASTGPVGRRAARLLAREGAQVRAASRRPDRAAAICDSVRASVPDADIEPVQTASDCQVPAALHGAQLVIAAGAAGIQLIPEKLRQQAGELRVAIDLNAVAPAGIAGIDPADKAVERDGQICYGAIGIGGTKMKIHKTAIRRLFESNDQVLDAEEIFALGKLIQHS